MKRVKIIISVIIIFLFSGRIFSNTEFGENIQKISKDTIIERNNPKSLDLSKHQIFIDTTRNSEFYKKLKNWTKSELDIKEITNSSKKHNVRFPEKLINLKIIPNYFISLRKLNNEFILYDRCDGIEQRYEITENLFVIYGTFETEVHSISKIIQTSKEKIELELNSYKSKSEFQKSFLKIEKISEYIYKMSFQNENLKISKYLTNWNKIEKFNLVVNHCPKMKMSEFGKFDGMKKTELIEIEK